jgi:hypothetical protein
MTGRLYNWFSVYKVVKVTVTLGIDREEKPQAKVKTRLNMIDTSGILRGYIGLFSIGPAETLISNILPSMPLMGLVTNTISLTFLPRTAGEQAGRQT